MRKSLTIVASQPGWYTIKVACDEGTIITNVRLEAGKPLDLSFVNDRPSINRPAPNTDKTWNKSSSKQNNNNFRRRR